MKMHVTNVMNDCGTSCLCFIVTGVLLVVLSLLLALLSHPISDGDWRAIFPVVIVFILLLFFVFSTWLQPENQDEINFKVSIHG